MNRDDHLRQIAGDPDDEGAYLVFADWLQERGDPLGRLIVLQHQIASDPGNAVVAATIDSLLRKHRNEWTAGLYSKPDIVFDWKWGFVRSLRILAGWDRKASVVDELLTSPVCSLLSEVIYFSEPYRAPEDDLARWKKLRPSCRFDLELPFRFMGDEEIPRETRWVQTQDEAATLSLEALPKLEWLEVAALGTQLPDHIGRLSGLRRLRLAGWNLRSIPEEIFALPKLGYLGLYSADLPKQYNMARINALLAGFLRAGTPPSRRVIESRLLLGYDKRADALASTDDLLAALDCNIEQVRRAAMRLLTSRLANPLIGEPFAKGDVVARLGQLDIDKDVVKERLAEIGVKVMTKVNAKTTHVLLGNRPRGKQLKLGSLKILLEDHVKPLLARAGSIGEDTGELAALLVSDDDDSICRAADALQRAGSVPTELWPEVLYVHQNTDLKGKGRKAVRKLFGAHAPEALRATVAEYMKTSILLAGETKRTRRLEALARDAGEIVDVHQLAEVFIAKKGSGSLFMFRHGSGAQIEKALDVHTEGTTMELAGLELKKVPTQLAKRRSLRTLNISANHLSRVPEEVLSLTELRDLQIAYNKLSELPEDISRLSKLRSLGVQGNRLSDLPESLAELSELRELDVHCNSLTRVPAVISRLVGLEVLNLTAEAYGRECFITELPADIGKLKNLRSLSLASQRIETFPPSFFDLSNLRELNVHGARLGPIPSELAKLGLTSIRLGYSSWAGGGENRIAELLPNCKRK